jgi:hypothetical protein
MTSSPAESWIKQLNQRVKGSEKQWKDDANAEATLHLARQMSKRRGRFHHRN